jgi:manganese transport protein
VQTRKYRDTFEGKREAIRFASIDSAVALMSALFINAAILVTAAATFHGTEHEAIANLGDAYQLLSPLLGTSLASALFAISLLCSGQSATLTGTLAGQIVMEGFINLRLRPWLRRLITRLIAIVPAIIVVLLYGERGIGSLLILSQVVLSLQLPFAVFPLIMFTSDPAKMGPFVTSLSVRACAWVVGGVIAALNLWLLLQTAAGM